MGTVVKVTIEVVGDEEATLHEGAPPANGEPSHKGFHGPNGAGTGEKKLFTASHDQLVARYAQDGLEGHGPAARITGQNITALRKVLTDARTSPTDLASRSDRRALAVHGRERAPLSKEQTEVIRDLVRDGRGINAKTFYGGRWPACSWPSMMINGDRCRAISVIPSAAARSSPARAKP